MLVRPVTASELMGRPEFPALIREYEAESKGAGLPTADARVESYRAMEAVGALHAFAAFDGDAVIGFISVIASKALHYHRIVPVSESWFVTRPARGSLAGLRLLKAAETRADELSDLGLRISVPAGHGIERLLEREGYTLTNLVLHKKGRAR